MLYLQSIPSRSREGAQIYAVGANNIYLPIYEISRPSNELIPAQQQKYCVKNAACSVWLLFTYYRHFRHPIRYFLKRKVGSCLAGCIIVVGSCLDLIHEGSIYGWAAVCSSDHLPASL